MPTVTEIKVDGYVSCIDPRCPGYEQRPVQVLQRTVQFSYQDNGGDGAIPQTAIERATIDIVQTDATCDTCGKPVIFAAVERPEYAAVSGSDPLELLNINNQTQIRDAQKSNLETAKETAELRAVVAEARAREAERDRRDAERDQMFADMKAELQRRKGGRPPKQEEE
jgi:hypothetical protein